MTNIPGGTPATNPPAEPGGRPAARVIGFAVGLLFTLVAIAGFIPGLTTNYDSLQFAGHDSEAQLFGLFQVSVLHNVLHLAFGVAGMMLARTTTGALAFLLIGGAIYLALWLYGLIIPMQSAWNFVPVDAADNWLHFGLGLGMVLLGAIAASIGRRAPAGRRS